MLRCNLRYGILCVLLLTGLSRTSAATERYTIDESQTTISFSVGRFGFLEDKGLFKKFYGTLLISSDQPEKDMVEMTLAATDIETHDESLNAEIKGPDFFDAVKFPEITFKSASVTVIDKGDAKIVGELTLHGVTKPIIFDAHFADIDRARETTPETVSFTASTVIRRSDFGMMNFPFLVGNEVKLDAEIVAVLVHE